MRDALVEVATRCLRKTTGGEYYYDDKDVQEIVDASVALGNGDDLVKASAGLIELAVFLRGQNGSRAAHTIATQVFASLAVRLSAATGGDQLRERARQLAELSSENSTTGAAMNRPAAKGVGLGRKR